MKRVLLALLAASPFAIGYCFHYALIQFNWAGTVVLLLSFLFLIYWFFAGGLAAKITKIKREALLIGNSFSALSLVLIVFQEVVLRRYFFNAVGFAPQMFYLPLVPLGTNIASVLLFFIPNHPLWATVVLDFLLMAAAYYAGFSVSRKNIET
ncbi:hypothetical protein [Caproiciproducens faecalis]|uniref:Uncharacterized protein n=1 Tax=Caproiciproducens faecalis TaxID=2820301 RepID=A0ABS7DNG7_9FIRM|nr:hypothetical protein [Caproiciproducens faecalis]MBW7572842.1 hypothetical protein [Caproiciproducens faecalis]